MTAWIEGTVVSQTRWTDRLLSLHVQTPDDAPALKFEAGQFAKLALEVEGERIARPYSFVNAPGAGPHEFYYAVVPEGPLTPHLAALGPGDRVFLAPGAAGFLVLSEVPDAENLWLLATGTGVGPFLSILRTETQWRRFRRVVLVHAARHAGELAYRDVIEGIAAAHPAQFASLRIASRDAPAGGVLQGRIPALIADGTLEARAGCALSAGTSHAMLCGNPAMVKDAVATLGERGMKKHRRRAPGHLTVENYW
ncbi:MAG: ferredoxin--NADP reductase [Betaproteobacteria bacterium]